MPSNQHASQHQKPPEKQVRRKTATYAAYRSSNRRGQNKARRLARHVIRMGYASFAAAPDGIPAAWHKLSFILPSTTIRDWEAKVHSARSKK